MSTNTKYKIGFYGYILVTVMTLISLIVYVSNVSTPYYEDMNVTVLIMMICALVALVGVVALTGKTQNKVFAIIVDFLRVLAAVLLIMSGVEFIGMRVESFGYIFGSIWKWVTKLLLVRVLRPFWQLYFS